MIKTIILDEAKVNEFIKQITPNPLGCKSMQSTNIDRPIDTIKKFLESTKIKTQ